MRSWQRWSVWVCLSLMLWTAAVESTHVHPSQSDSSSCTLCLVAHTTRPTISSTHTAPVFVAVGQMHDKDFVVQAWLDVSDIGIRGPPVL